MKARRKGLKFGIESERVVEDEIDSGQRLPRTCSRSQWLWFLDKFTNSKKVNDGSIYSRFLFEPLRDTLPGVLKLVEDHREIFICDKPVAGEAVKGRKTILKV